MLIRFKKNDGTKYPQWEKEVLNNILNLKSKTNHKVEDSINNGPYLFFTNGEKTLFFNSYDFDGEHIIINTGGKADFRYYNGKFAASSDCLVVTSNICTAYVYYYLKKLIDVINDKYFTGSGLRHLNKKSFLKKVISIPCLEEQQKIADFLSAVDQKIGAQKSIVTDYEELKKGIMQKIFNQEVRFKDDDGNEFPEWEEKKFGNYIEEFSNKTRIENETTLLSSAINGMFLNSELFGHQRGSSNIGYKKVNKGTLILSTQNLHLGNANVNLRFEEGMVSPAYKTYKLIECDEKFMSYWIKREEAKTFFFNATTVGASMCRRNVEWDELYNSKINIPCITEQKKIADCLSAIDKKIEAEKKILADLEELKRGLLQAIFNN